MKMAESGVDTLSLKPLQTAIDSKTVQNFIQTLTLLHSEQPKLHRVLAVLSALGLKVFSSFNDGLVDINLGCRVSFQQMWFINKFGA